MARTLFGRHLIMGLHGSSLTEAERELLTELKPRGILLLARNFDYSLPYSGWIGKLRTLLDEVYSLVGDDKLFITLDHEGGTVHRAPAPITRFPSPVVYRSQAAEVAKIHAREVKSLGVNVSWSPLSDIHSNPQNPVIGPRAFGTTPDQVIPPMLEYLDALESEGVLGCAKHFPGHGDTASDSHYELPLLHLDEQTIRHRELVPFKAMIDAGVSLIMTAHVLFPGIDSEFPATLSEKILTKILREEFQYKHLIISDDLDMKAVSEDFLKGEAFAQSLRAGCDMYILARNIRSSPERALIFADEFEKVIQAQPMLQTLQQEAEERIQNVLPRLHRYVPEELSLGALTDHATRAIEIALQREGAF